MCEYVCAYAGFIPRPTLDCTSVWTVCVCECAYSSYVLMEVYLDRVIKLELLEDSELS